MFDVGVFARDVISWMYIVSNSEFVQHLGALIQWIRDLLLLHINQPSFKKKQKQNKKSNNLIPLFWENLSKIRVCPSARWDKPEYTIDIGVG